LTISQLISSGLLAGFPNKPIPHLWEEITGFFALKLRVEFYKERCHTLPIGIDYPPEPCGSSLVRTFQELS